MDTISRIKRIAFGVLLACTCFYSQVHAETNYDLGIYSVKDIWVDPAAGVDSRDGSTRALAIRDVNTAMILINTTGTTKTGFRIMLVAGIYSVDSVPQSYGPFAATAEHPIIFQAADGDGTVSLPGFSLTSCNYWYFIGLNIHNVYGGDAFAAKTCDHILLRHCSIDGLNSDTSGVLSQNTVDLSGSQHCYLEGCTIRHASAFLVSSSAVQYGHVLDCRLDSAIGNGCFVVGSAYVYFEHNIIETIAGIGFILGGTSNLDYDFTMPWVHYDTYAIKIDNNLFVNILHEAFLANGSYDALIAYNTFYKVGVASRTLCIIGCGNRTCGFDQLACKALLDSGAWGTVHIYQTDDDAAWIPNKHLFIYNNLFYDPVGFQTTFGQLSVWGPRKALSHAQCPNPAYADDDLEIKGNFIVNGALSKPLGITDTSGCQSSNPTCNIQLIVLQNTFSTSDPLLTDPAAGNLHPAPGSILFTATTYVIPDFGWSDLPGKPFEPQGDLSNRITTDFDGKSRSAGADAPGSFNSSFAEVRPNLTSSFDLGEPVPNPSASSSEVTLVVAERAVVTVGIYDLLGNQIAVVAERIFDAGNYTLELPTQHLESGVYYLRAVSGSNILTKKIVVFH